jgi:tetratricopeptide (TPR) repeat protein
MFRKLGPNARNLLSVIAFFPQGVNKNNLDWLFPTISDRRNIFDKFCILSLTYQNNGFITMLAPLRDYLSPKDPKSFPLLCMTKDHYFGRLSVDVDPGKPGFEEARWITLEDVNVEHLLNVFTSIDANSVDVWETCASFMEHLYWHKPRLIMLGPKIEGLPDNQPSKLKCLFHLSQLFDAVGNAVEEKRLLVYTLEFWREQGNDFWVIQMLTSLAEANRRLGLYTEGIQQVKESLGISKQLNYTLGQAVSLRQLAWLLYDNNQFDAAEEAASCAINLLPANSNLLPDKGNQFLVCQCYRVLGLICYSKGETEVATNHFESALGIASSFDWRDEQFWNHYSLADLFINQGIFGDAHTHIEHARSYEVNNTYLLGCTMWLQSQCWYREHRLEEAKSEALCAADVFEKFRATKQLEVCREFLWLVEEEMNKLVTSGEPNFNSELLEIVLPPTPVNPPFPAHGTK